MLTWTMRKLGFDPRTVAYVRRDVARLAARLRMRRRSVLKHAQRLHLGCGNRKVDGWLNCDMSGSEFDLDLAAGRLPFPDDSIDVVVMQHVIEHLDLHDQLIPLFHELYRVLTADGRLWLSCPDLAKVCAAYLADRGRALEEDRRSRWPDYSLDGAPVQHFINDLFHQDGEHRNLFDLELLTWTLNQAGFVFVRRVTEADLLAAHPEFPPRRDDLQSLYVVASKTEKAHDAAPDTMIVVCVPSATEPVADGTQTTIMDRANGAPDWGRLVPARPRVVVRPVSVADVVRFVSDRGILACGTGCRPPPPAGRSRAGGSSWTCRRCARSV